MCSPKPGHSGAGGTRSAMSWPRCPSPPTPDAKKALAEIYNAENKTHAVNAPHLDALVRAGAKFVNGRLVERPDASGGVTQAACHADPQVQEAQVPVTVVAEDEDEGEEAFRLRSTGATNAAVDTWDVVTSTPPPSTARRRR
jgi:hypothetical protein